MQCSIVFLQVSASISDVSVSVSYTKYAPKVPKAGGYHSHPAAVRRRGILTSESAFWSDLLFLANNYSEVSPIWAMIVVLRQSCRADLYVTWTAACKFYQTSNLRLALVLISPYKNPYQRYCTKYYRVVTEMSKCRARILCWSIDIGVSSQQQGYCLWRCNLITPAGTFYTFGTVTHPTAGECYRVVSKRKPPR